MAIKQSVLSLLTLATTVAAECQCGYTVNSTDTQHFTLFTDLIETDFLHIKDVTFNNSYDIGWIPQKYNTTPAQDNGPYGMAKQDRNLVPNYIDSEYNWVGPGVEGIDPGLQLYVRSQTIKHQGEKLVPSAELVTQRDDILYGSFRVAMKTTAINGTCSAFYFYRNDSQEIDFEILSAEQHMDTNNWPVHLIAQNTTAVKGDAKPNYGGESQMIYQMPFPPGGSMADYNEYRFDWLPGRIDFYINSWHAWTTRENVPSTPGRVHISQWSNGNKYWSHGPPIQDAILTVSYMKAYFNSTNSTRNHQYHHSCPRNKYYHMLKETCEIPNQERPPNPMGAEGNTTGHTFFFADHHNMVKHQTVYYNPLTASASRFSNSPAMMILAFIAVATSFVNWTTGNG